MLRHEKNVMYLKLVNNPFKGTVLIKNTSQLNLQTVSSKALGIQLIAANLLDIISVDY